MGQLSLNKNIHKSDRPHCLWLDKSLLTLKYIKMHYSPYFLPLIIMAWAYFPQPQVPKPVSFEWHWTSSWHICQPQTEAIKILKLCVFLVVIFLLGCFTWISTRWCSMKKQSVHYTSHFSIHSMQAMAICSRNGSRCLNCGISRVLESWPFWSALLMHLCIVTVQQGWSVLTHFVDICLLI